MAKLNHLPFEDWLLSEETLTQEEAGRLQEHLQGCEVCSMLALALSEVDRELRAAPVLPPVAGFVNRWQARLEAERQKLHRRQTFFTMLLSIGGAMFFFALLAIVLLPVILSPWPVLLALVYELTSTFSFVSVIGEALLTVLRALFDLFPVTQWAAIWLAFAGLGALWVVALHRLTLPRRIIT